MTRQAAPAAQPRVAALVLAAGRSTRMAPHNKLLLRDGCGRPMVAHVAASCLASRAACTVVVTGHQAAEVRQAVRDWAGEAAGFAHAPDYAAGLSASLRAGLEALPPWVDGVIVCLGDMPLVGPGMIDRLIAAFAPEQGGIVVPVWQGRRGNPVLWSRALFGALCSLHGDAGGRGLLASHGDRVAAVEADGPGVLTDYDAPACLPACWQAAAGAEA